MTFLSVCILIGLLLVILMYDQPENGNQINPTVEQSYRLVYTLALNSNYSGQINLNWTIPANKTHFQTVDLLNLTTSPSLIESDENGNEIAHFSINLTSSKNLEISMTAEIAVNNTKWASSTEPITYDTNSTILKAYTQPETFIESDNPFIIDMARNITQSYSDPLNSSQAICKWVHENMKYSNFSETPHGAIWALENRTGDCSEYAFLFIALCRASHIPARFVDGLTTWNINTTSWGNQNWTSIGHDWAEVYLQSQGWVWVDPTSNDYGCSDGQHIALQVGQYCESLNGNYRYSYNGNGKITEHFEIYLQG